MSPINSIQLFGGVFDFLAKVLQIFTQTFAAFTAGEEYRKDKYGNKRETSNETCFHRIVSSCLTIDIQSCAKAFSPEAGAIVTKARAAAQPENCLRFQTRVRRQRGRRCLIAELIMTSSPTFSVVSRPIGSPFPFTTGRLAKFSIIIFWKTPSSSSVS